jgi:hypothetical protein
MIDSKANPPTSIFVQQEKIVSQNVNIPDNNQYEARKKIFDEIKKFTKTEQEELYRIIKRCKEEVSENKNGIFFDLMNLQEETVTEIQKWISFCNKNRVQFEIREKEMIDLQEANPGINQ